MENRPETVDSFIKAAADLPLDQQREVLGKALHRALKEISLEELQALKEIAGQFKDIAPYGTILELLEGQFAVREISGFGTWR